MSAAKSKLYAGLTALLVVAACVAADRTFYTTFESLKTEQGFAYYRYKAPADPIHPANTEAGEAYRMEMLALWLDDYGHGLSKPEIVERHVMLRDHRLLSDFYDVHYVVRVPVTRQ